VRIGHGTHGTANGIAVETAPTPQHRQTAARQKPLAQAAILVSIALLLPAAAGAAEYRVPLMREAPTLDGKIGVGEWELAAGFDGFAMGGKLERRRVQAFVAATKRALHFAIRSQLPDEGQILAQVNVDTVKIVYDDSVEVWIDPTPGSDHGKTFQMLANAIGRQGYKLHVRGNVPDEPAWRGDWQVAHGFHEGYWHCEVAVPIEGIAPGRTADQGQWAINLCRNWKQPWAFSSLGGGAYAPEDTRYTFVETDALAIAHEIAGDPFLGELDTSLSLTNPARQTMSVRAEMVMTRDVMPELRAAEDLTLGPGETKQIGLEGEDQATRKFDLGIRVTSPDSQRAYYERSYAWERGEPWKWTVAKKEVLPIDFQFGYYPYLNKMRVLADVSNLPGKAALDHLTCAIRKNGQGDPIKTVTFGRFVDGRQELEFDLPPLDGEYEIAVRAHGENVAEGELVKECERTLYDWEHLGLGTSTKVYPPFTPIRVEGKRVATVLREHTMNDLGLWEQVIAKGEELLAGPMAYRAVVDGKQQFELRGGPLRFVKREGNEAIAETTITGDGISAEVRCTWDYDGMMRVDMQLAPHPGRTVEQLTLHIPLRQDQATHFHAMGDGIRNTIYEAIPAFDGIAWDSSKVAVNDFPANFCSYIYMGTPTRGLCWFAENDKSWSLDRESPNVTWTTGGAVDLEVHFITEPVEITEPRTITFGLLAAPVKPRLGNWRYKYNRDNYTLLGTDINWFALGNCGAVYPAKKDLYLWEMLARGNREQLSDDEITQVIEHGLPYFEPYGEDYVERYVRHVRHNLRSRFGKKMILYYNRASYQAADEFQTFQDEWCLTDYRTVGTGNGIGEIKLVPTESYIDHALYWYDKAFDVAGSVGVYWDNWFFKGSYNRMMTSAYERADGSIMPSNGLWGLRELSKRTFQLMNERGMLPITMAHMTSTQVLPLHSFCTVQYDWEWKYSEGDVQYRFPREYILLVSSGELAGTWPVLLGDHGKLATDPWTQRTFAAVSIVHELTGYGLPAVWDPLLQPVYALLDDENLEVYRYWDERPQPVTTGKDDLPTIVYSVKGREAVFAVTSYAEEDVEGVVSIDPQTLGFGEGYGVTDVESGDRVPVHDNAIRLTIKKHDIREFRIVPEGAL
jgi:hypothetical protein